MDVSRRFFKHSYSCSSLNTTLDSDLRSDVRLAEIVHFTLFRLIFVSTNHVARGGDL